MRIIVFVSTFSTSQCDLLSCPFALINAERQRRRTSRLRPALGSPRKKQALLIHTAPVFSPTSPSFLPVVASGLGHKGVESSVQVSVALHELDIAYEEARDKANYQKQNVLRWIKRQALRMNCQVMYLKLRCIFYHLSQMQLSRS